MPNTRRNTPIEILDGNVGEAAATRVIVKFTEALNYNNDLMEKVLEYTKGSTEYISSDDGLVKDLADELNVDLIPQIHAYLTSEEGLHLFMKNTIKKANDWTILKVAGLLGGLGGVTAILYALLN